MSRRPNAEAGSWFATLKIGLTCGLEVPLVWMHAFQVGEHHVTVESMVMISSRMLDHGIGNYELVVAHEVASAARTSLLEGHTASSYERCHDKGDHWRPFARGP